MAFYSGHWIQFTEGCKYHALKSISKTYCGRKVPAEFSDIEEEPPSGLFCAACIDKYNKVQGSKSIDTKKKRSKKGD